MEPNPIAPTRRKQPFMRKVKTGCITCKARKVKCDESQPYCNRCISAGRSCAGYAAVDRRQSSSPTPRLNPSRDVESSMPAWLASTAEKRSFHFFLAHASKQLDGFSSAAFWSREVLQAALAHPPIRHLVVALGAAYEGFGDRGNNNHDAVMTLAIQQCNSAIRGLSQLPSAGPQSASGGLGFEETSSVLTAAVLFTMFALLQGHVPEALGHMRSGLRVLQHLDASTNAGSHSKSRARPGPFSASTPAAFPIPLNRLRALLTVLYAQARAMLNDEAKTPWSGPDPLLSPAKPASCYVSLADAQADVETLFANTLAFFQANELHTAASLEQQEAIRSHQEELREALRASRTALEEFAARQAGKTATPGESSSSEAADAGVGSGSAITVLRLYQVLLTVRLEIDARREDTREAAFDTHEAHFATMLALARSVIENQQSRDDQAPESRTGIQPTCASGLGLVMPLHMVAARCRNQGIRREAVTLLKRCGRREGPWDSALVALTLEVWIEMEEGLGGVAIDGDARIREVKLHFEGERKARVEFITMGQWKWKQEGEYRALTW